MVGLRKHIDSQSREGIGLGQEEGSPSPLDFLLAPGQLAEKASLHELPDHLPVPVGRLDPGFPRRCLDRSLQLGLFLPLQGRGTARLLEGEARRTRFQRTSPQASRPRSQSTWLPERWLSSLKTSEPPERSQNSRPSIILTAKQQVCLKWN